MPIEMFQVLIEFFLQEFAFDPTSVSDWLMQGGDDPGDFVRAIEATQMHLQSFKETCHKVMHVVN